MPTRDDRHAVWTRLDTEGTGTLSFEQIGRAVAELFRDRAWHKGSRKRALALACRSVELSHEGWVQRSEFKRFLQHIVYFVNRAQQLERAEAECQSQGRLTLAEFLRAAAAAGAPVGKSAAVEAFWAMAALETQPQTQTQTHTQRAAVDKSVAFDDFCQWCAAHHISQVRKKQVFFCLAF